jgi:hypothetical protein
VFGSVKFGCERMPWKISANIVSIVGVMLLNCLDVRALRARRGFIGNFLWGFLLSFLCVCWLTGCGDVNNVSGPPAPAGPGPLTITTTSLPDGTVNQPYATTVGGSGGITPYAWSVTPGLPANLTFDSTTGVISGTPAADGNSTHTFTLGDSSSPVQTVQQSLSLTINTASPVLSITTTSLPNGAVGQAYNENVQSTGGTGALTWSIVAGTLPQNLILNSTTGLISGTPNAPGTSSFTVRVADTTGQVDTQALSILIDPATPPIITTPSLDGGTVGLAYSQPVQATGGTGTLVWSVSGGSLPANLTLSSDGVISGTPTNTGTSNFTVKVTDALSQSDTQPLSITISPVPPPLTITTNSLPVGRRNRSYAATLKASGGTTPYTWSVTPALPGGLILAPATGVISGRPTATSDIDLDFTVRDSTNQTATKQLNLRIRR